MGSEIFEEMYKGVPLWEIDAPQSEIIHLAEHGEIRSPVLDVGCGTGENAIFLAALGIEVVGTDIAPTAVEKAINKAKERSSDATFLVCDSLRLEDLQRRFKTVLDSGFFHVLPDKKRPVFVKSLASVLEPGGSYIMICFSEHEPGSWGPKRVTRDEILESFKQGWSVDYIREATYDTNLDSRKSKAWLCSITLVGNNI